jgi:(p)ppGpp synthase/HD superfamily hydrolase
MIQKELNEILHFAAIAHQGQTRKYTGEPYIVHPIAVANKVAEIGGSMEMQAAALLHDVLEDTDVSVDELGQFLFCTVAVKDSAEDILDMVIDLTDEFEKVKYPDLNRKTRKAMEADRLSKVSADAQTVKYCDLFDNTLSITEHDPKFSKVYLKEKAVLLEAMTDGNVEIRQECLNQIK